MSCKFAASILVMLTILLLAGCVTSVDPALPYDELPTITVATAVQLVASPSHPTSYLEDGEIASGTKVRLIGADEDAAWLLVLADGQLGWMSTFYSRTNIGRIKPAIIIDPLPSACTKYLDTTSELDSIWDSYMDGSLIILGSILLPNAVGDAFDEATLNVNIDGDGVVSSADYIHTLLTRSKDIILFGFAIDGLETDSRISFELRDAGEEEVSFQAAFFANTCPEDVPSSGDDFTDSLPVGALKRSVSTPTPELATETPTPEISTPQATKVTPPHTRETTPTEPRPIVITSGPPKSSSSLSTEIEQVLRLWDKIHHRSDRTLDPSELPLILTGDALEQQRNTLKKLRDSDCYWVFTDLEPPEVLAIRELTAKEVLVDSRKHWDGNLYCRGDYIEKSSFDDPFFIHYRMVFTDRWRIAEKNVIDEDELMSSSDNGGNSSIPSPQPVHADQRLKDRLLQKSRQSRVSLEHRQQAALFVDALLLHLGDFRMPNIGVTEQSMRDALQRRDAGDRLNSLVQEVWDDWNSNARQRGFNAYSTDPGGMGFSPFRQLVIRMIQGRQGRLSNSQQHALHNYFTRSESADVWRNDPDAVIGAINRESFQWP